MPDMLQVGRNRRRFPRFNRIIAIGDSITAFNDGPKDYIFSPLEFYNEAVSGYTLAQMDAATGGYLAGNPDADSVYLLGGINSAVNGVTLAAMKTSCQSIMAKVEFVGLDLLVVSCTPSRAWTNWTQPEYDIYLAYNEWLPTECEARGHSFVNVYEELREPQTDNLLPAYGALSGADPVHLGPAGGERCGGKIEAALTALRKVPGPVILL